MVILLMVMMIVMMMTIMMFSHAHCRMAKILPGIEDGVSTLYTRSILECTEVCIPMYTVGHSIAFPEQ